MESDESLDALVQDAKLLKSVLPTLLESEQALLCHFIASKLFDRFEQTGSMDDLDRGITMMEQANASTADDHPDYAKYLNDLGFALQREDRIDDRPRSGDHNEGASYRIHTY
jgi:hypothetical protein